MTEAAPTEAALIPAFTTGGDFHPGLKFSSPVQRSLAELEAQITELAGH